jgi:hypothetical protein
MNTHSAESGKERRQTPGHPHSRVEPHHDFLVYRKANARRAGNKPEEYSDEEQTVD